MKINDLMDLTLREILENYVVIHNLECDYFYGIAPITLIDKLFNEYNILEEYPESFGVENIISDELIVSYDEELLNYVRLERIMDNLGISKKKERL